MKKRLISLTAVLLLLAVCMGSLVSFAETTPATPAEKAKALGLPEPPDIDITSWEFLYAGTYNGVSRYSPPEFYYLEDQYFDSRMAQSVKDFLAAARAEGYRVWICSAYRNFEYTINWYDKYMLRYGSSYETAKHVFAPGTSEHSTALAFDITDEQDLAANYYEMHDEDILDSEVYKWMAAHCHEYGFIVRYPENKADYYGMACNYGHFRYVGYDAASYIMENDLCLEEFIALYK